MSEGVDSSLVGHNTALELFSRSLDLSRLCSTYLFTGSPGIGKRVAAKECARLILCHDRNGTKACGTCSSCLAFAANRHPRYNERDFGAEKKGGESVVDVVRNFIEEVQRLGRDGEPLIFMVPNIQDYSVQVQNALLKTLEEPPAGVIFLLTVDRPQLLLETIKSRSQIIYLSPLSVSEMKIVLQRHQCNVDELDLIMRMCEGRVDLALRFTHDAYKALIQWAEKKLLKPEQDFIDTAEQLMTLSKDLEYSDPNEENEQTADRTERDRVSEAIRIFERIFFQKCIDRTKYHFVGMQVFNTTVEELLSARKSIENSGHVALSLEHYMQLAMARLAQILRFVKIPETGIE